MLWKVLELCNSLSGNGNLAAVRDREAERPDCERARGVPQGVRCYEETSWGQSRAVVAILHSFWQSSWILDSCGQSPCHWKKKASKRATERASDQASKQAIKQASKPTTSTPTSKQANKQAHQPSKQHQQASNNTDKHATVDSPWIHRGFCQNPRFESWILDRGFQIGTVDFTILIYKFVLVCELAFDCRVPCLHVGLLVFQLEPWICNVWQHNIMLNLHKIVGLLACLLFDCRVDCLLVGLLVFVLLLMFVRVTWHVLFGLHEMDRQRHIWSAWDGQAERERKRGRGIYWDTSKDTQKRSSKLEAHFFNFLKKRKMRHLRKEK